MAAPRSSVPRAADEAVLPLGHIRLLRPPLTPMPAEWQGTPREGIYDMSVNSIEIAMQYAEQLGATIVRLSGVEAYAAEMAANDPRTFMLFNDLSVLDAQDGIVNAALSRLPEGIVRRPVTTPLAACTMEELFGQLRAGRPFMIAYPREHRGHCKYLIEEAWQLDRVLQFCADDSEEPWLNLLEVRDYTPHKFLLGLPVLN